MLNRYYFLLYYPYQTKLFTYLSKPQTKALNFIGPSANSSSLFIRSTSSLRDCAVGPGKQNAILGQPINKMNVVKVFVVCFLHTVLNRSLNHSPNSIGYSAKNSFQEGAESIAQQWVQRWTKAVQDHLACRCLRHYAVKAFMGRTQTDRGFSGRR